MLKTLLYWGRLLEVNLVAYQSIFISFLLPQVTGKLFRGEEKFGIDLVAINLQRGRDHGVGGYQRARMYCGLPPHTNFTELALDMDAGALASIQQVYRLVEKYQSFAMDRSVAKVYPN